MTPHIAEGERKPKPKPLTEERPPKKEPPKKQPPNKPPPPPK